MPTSLSGLFFDDYSEGDACWVIAASPAAGFPPDHLSVPARRVADVPLNVILVADDRAVRLDWALPAARARLGGREPILVPGSHSPFVSRPSDLADILAAEAAR